MSQEERRSSREEEDIKTKKKKKNTKKKPRRSGEGQIAEVRRQTNRRTLTAAGFGLTRLALSAHINRPARLRVTLPPDSAGSDRVFEFELPPPPSSTASDIPPIPSSDDDDSAIDVLRQQLDSLGLQDRSAVTRDRPPAPARDRVSAPRQSNSHHHHHHHHHNHNHRHLPRQDSTQHSSRQSPPSSSLSSPLTPDRSSSSPFRLRSGLPSPPLFSPPLVQPNPLPYNNLPGFEYVLAHEPEAAAAEAAYQPSQSSPRTQPSFTDPLRPAVSSAAADNPYSAAYSAFPQPEPQTANRDLPHSFTDPMNHQPVSSFPPPPVPQILSQPLPPLSQPLPPPSRPTAASHSSYPFFADPSIAHSHSQHLSPSSVCPQCQQSSKPTLVRSLSDDSGRLDRRQRERERDRDRDRESEKEKEKEKEKERSAAKREHERQQRRRERERDRELERKLERKLERERQLNRELEREREREHKLILKELERAQRRLERVSRPREKEVVVSSPPVTSPVPIPIYNPWSQPSYPFSHMPGGWWSPRDEQVPRVVEQKEPVEKKPDQKAALKELEDEIKLLKGKADDSGKYIIIDSFDVKKRWQFPLSRVRTWQSLELFLLEAFPESVRPLIDGGFYEIRLASDHRSILPSVWSEVVQPNEEYEIILLDPPPPPAPPPPPPRRRWMSLMGGGNSGGGRPAKNFKEWFSESDKRAR